MRNATGQPTVAQSGITVASPRGSFDTNGTESSGHDVPPEHNAAAHKLFRWPAIKRLLDKSKLQESEKGEDYVMTMERNRGMPSSANNPSDESDEDWSENRSCVGGPLIESALGGLQSNNTLKLDSPTIDTLLQNYIRHLHVLHPFLDEQHLMRQRQMIHFWSAPLLLRWFC